MLSMPLVTAADVDRLMSNRSAVTRSHIAVRVASTFRKDTLTPSERRIAEDILRAFAGDAAVRVRKAVSYHLKHCAFLPHDIAVRIAEDVDSVAIPFLEASEVLTDADLVRIVRDHGTAKQLAISRRRTVSAEVADALIDTENERVVLSLVSNDGAEISEAALNRVVDGYADHAAVTEAMVHRRQLPVDISARLIAHVSDGLRDYLVAHHRLPRTLAADIALMGRERALFDLLCAGDDRGRVEAIIRDLRRNNHLTPTLLLRGLCCGRMDLFEAGMAALAATPLERTRKLMRDAWPYGFEAIYRSAGLPPPLLPAFRTGFRVVTGPAPADGDDAPRTQCLARAISAEYGGLGAVDLETVLGRLKHRLRDRRGSARH